jgi:phosphate uptake regulator
MTEALHTPKLLALDVCVKYMEDNLDHFENIALVIQLVKGKKPSASVVVDYESGGHSDIVSSDGKTAEEAIRSLANQMQCTSQTLR